MAKPVSKHIPKMVAYEARLVDTAYQASEDGILVAQIALASSGSVLSVIWGVANPPVDDSFSVKCNSTDDYKTLTVPIRKNLFYKIYIPVGSGNAYGFWFPIR